MPGISRYLGEKKNQVRWMSILESGEEQLLSRAVGQRLTRGYVGEEGSRQRKQNHRSRDGRRSLVYPRVRKEASVEHGKSEER